MTAHDSNTNRKVYNIDFDNTITFSSSDYSSFKPNPEMIAKVQELYQAGNIIIIWTARWWNQAPIIAAWLIHHSVPFHGIFMGKGGSDYYIDDKNILISDFMEQKG